MRVLGGRVVLVEGGASREGTGLFEVTLHHTVVRTEEEEVEIGETEKDNDQISECPPCHEGGEIKRALRWSSQPLDVPAEQRGGL